MLAGPNKLLDTVVIGAGVVGLATARAMAQKGHEVFVLEQEAKAGQKASSRNSEVIHAGIYYPPESHKARLCVDGRQLLYRYLSRHNIPHRRLGKFIVATEEGQIAQLEQLADNARRCGVESVELMDRPRELEPAIHAQAALWSPDSGILDSHAYIQTLIGELETLGGHVVYNTAVQSYDADLRISLHNGDRWRCRQLINAAGAQAGALLRRAGGIPEHCILPQYFAKGHYFRLQGRPPCQYLVYPLPGDHGLGIHLTLDLNGQARFGPEVHWQESADDDTFEAEIGPFVDAIRRYYPGLDPKLLKPDYTGIRARVAGPDDPPGDFIIQGPQQHGIAGLVNLLGIDSPGLTASLAIGQATANSVTTA